MYFARKHLYSGCIVRWPSSALSQYQIINFTNPTDRQKYLIEDDSDTPQLVEALRMARSYSKKDKEAVLLVGVGYEHIEF